MRGNRRPSLNVPRCPAVLAVILIVALLASCAKRPPTATPMLRADARATARSLIAPTALPDGAVAIIRQAHTISIHDDWSSLSLFAPRKIAYELRRTASGFSGTGTFSVGSGTHWATRPLTISMEEADAFLRSLTTVPVREGVYEPNITHTDDYPDIGIDLIAENGKVSFYTKSQGPGNVPWGIEVARKYFNTYSTQPLEALTALSPDWQRNVIRGLETDMQQSMAATATAQPLQICESSMQATAVASSLHTPEPNSTPIVDPNAPLHVGDTVNIVERIGIARKEPFKLVFASTAPQWERTVADPQLIAAIIEALSHPALVIPEPADSRISRYMLTLQFKHALGGYVALTYSPKLQLLEYNGSGHLALQASPVLAGLIAQAICTK